MQQVECFLDDVNQVYLSANKNFKYELIQAFKSFGFGDVNSNLTVNEINEVLLAYKCSTTNEDRDNILTGLFSQSKLPRLRVIMEGIESSMSGFGSDKCAIIVDENSVWLLIKEKVSNEFIESIHEISLSYGVFLVDAAQGVIVNSESKCHIEEYFEYDN